MKTIPPSGATEREVHTAVRELIEGRSNATGTVTLRANQTTTVVEKSTINGNSNVFLFPATANAAAATATTFATVTPGGGSFTVTHTSAASTDRTFNYLVNGG